jgi:hypothetical protein
MKNSRLRAGLGRAARLLLFSVVLMALVAPAAQAAVTRIWVKRYDGPADDVDSAAAIAFDSAGNVYVAGRSTSANDEDYIVIKRGPGGAKKWVRRYDGAGLWDGARGIAVDDSGNVYVTGRSFGSGSHGDFATLKYNSSGALQWVKRYSSSGYYDDGAMDIALDHWGNVIVTGFSTGPGSAFDFLTIKYSPTGVRKWVKRYDGPGNGGDIARAVDVDSAGNVYVTGPSRGDGTDWDYCTIKYGPSGARLWVRRWNSYFDLSDGATDLVVDPFDYIYVTGYTYRSRTNADYMTLQYDSDGKKIWQRRYEGPAKGVDTAWAIAWDYGRVYVTGASMGRHSDSDWATVCYKRWGTKQWVKRLNGSANGTDVPNAIAASKGQVYVTGFATGAGSDGDYMIAKYGAFGFFKWTNRYNGPGNGFDQANDVGICPASGNVYITGGSRGTVTGVDIATIKYAP